MTIGVEIRDAVLKLSIGRILQRSRICMMQDANALTSSSRID